MNGKQKAIAAIRHAAFCTGCYLTLTLTAQAQGTLNPDARAQVPSAQSTEPATGALPEGRGVTDRARPEYDAAGIPLGGFQLFPTLAADFAADDNIYDSSVGTSDTRWTISPRFDLRSNWNSNAVQLYGQLDHYEYDSHETESHTNWIVGGAGRLDFAPGSFANGAVYYFDTHESRTSPDLSSLALSPTRYKRLSADATATGRLNFISLSADLTYDRFDYDMTKLIGGGTIDNSDRDRNVYEMTGKASYEFAPDHAVFMQFTYDKRDFDHLFDRNGIDRNSDGYRADVGGAMMLTPLIQGTAYVGWLQQNYVTPLRSANGLDFNGQIDWFATELITAHLTASRTIDDTTITGASSVDVRRVSASVDYEFLRDLILRANLNYSDDKFDGITRDDKITSAGLEGKYLINNYLSANAGYTFQQRATNASSRDFTDNLFTIGIRGQL